jgi:hypothetical protein
MVDRLEGFFAHDLPSTMEVLPTDTEARPAPVHRETSEQTGSSVTEPKTTQSKDNLTVPSEFMAVRSIRLAAKEAIARSQDAYREMDANLKNHARELERRQEALSAALETEWANLQQLQAKITKDLTDELEKASQAMLSRSVAQLHEQAAAAVAALDERLSTEKQRFVAETQRQFEELRASRQSFVDDTQKQLSAMAQSAQQFQDQADSGVAALNQRFSAEKERFVAETQQQFEQLRASRQSFMDDTQKQLSAMARSSLDPLTKAAVEKARAELDASKQEFINNTQKELTSSSRTALGVLTKDWTKDLIEHVRAEVTASKQGFIADVQNELARTTGAALERLESLVNASVEQGNANLMASHQQVVDETQRQVAGMTQVALESHVKASVEQARRELSHMVNEFLAKGVPQIEAELRNLVKRHGEAVRQQAAQPQITDALRLTPVHPVPPQGHSLQFVLAESAPKGRVELRDVWAGLAPNMTMGLALGVVVLIMLAIYLSASPVVRLQVRPPAAFFDDSPSLNAKQRAREDELARAYWDIAVRDIEAKYSSGSTLPADPPDDFKVGEKGPSGTILKVDAAARTRYWQKLREVWAQPDSWERTSNWSLDWIRSVWDSTSSRVAQVFGSGHTSAAPGP